MTVGQLRGAVTQRIVNARKAAEYMDMLNSAEAAAVEKRLRDVEEMAAAKVACDRAMAANVAPNMTSDELRAVVQTEHDPAIRRAQNANVSDSLEYANLKERKAWALSM
mmetsp:Transcript_17168/g.31148  ORF Transcript_17168/g.31148 Transcript_17168/m.31148 type:complete len:109 (-) Transcript_17168:405-731(-)